MPTFSNSAPRGLDPGREGRVARLRRQESCEQHPLKCLIRALGSRINHPILALNYML